MNTFLGYIGRKKYILAASVLLLLPLVLMLAWGFPSAVNGARYLLMDKRDLNINLSIVNTGVRALTADPSNMLVLKASIHDANGAPVPEASFRLSAGGAAGHPVASGSFGSFSPQAASTGSDGTCLISYRPPRLSPEAFANGAVKLELTAAIPGGETASINLDLVRIPVIFIHGYKASPELFNSMKEFLEPEGFSTNGFSYDSDKGVASGADQLQKYIDTLKRSYAAKGIQADRFDIIAHSMGGLVARYYTCSPGYAERGDVEKLIFLSVPHNGSPIASLGLKYYSDKGIYDLIPDSSLYASTFPSMINQGLNNTIQTGNLLGQYDEVVTPESASLEAWNIKTEMFAVGDNNFTLDKLISGEIVEASNHKNILFNKKVFERVARMLGSTLPCPSAR